MEEAWEAAPGGQAGAELPMEPVGSLVPTLEQPQVPAKVRQPEGPESSPSPAGAVEKAAGAGLEPSSKKKPSSPRPGSPRVPPLSLGYGVCPEPPSPGPALVKLPRNGEAPGAEPAPSAWAPMELQVDVRVKPVGAAGGSSTPSPRPSTRFLTVPVPESPAFSRHADPAHQLLLRAPSQGGTWGRRSPLAAARTESGCDAEGRASPAEGSAGSPGSPTCCRCKELGLEKEDAALLPRAGLDGDEKLPRAVTLTDSLRTARTIWISTVGPWRKARWWLQTAALQDPGSVPRGPSDLGSAWSSACQADAAPPTGEAS
uniref:Killer cell lectin like receptor G2 n=1 Tax=Pan troglodytes TaxID=9598 RepID=H2QVH1_PANTR